MKCPRCQSEDVTVAKYKYCKSCSYRWTKGIRGTYKGKEECPDCGSKNTRSAGRKRNNRRYYCNDCGASWWAKSKTKIRPSEKKHWIKWIQEEYEKGVEVKRIKN